MAKRSGHQGPETHYQKGISLKGLFRLFPDNEAAEKWFQEQMWGDPPHCLHCGSTNVNMHVKHRTMQHRCKENGCYNYFSEKMGTVTEATVSGSQDWAIARWTPLTACIRWFMVPLARGRLMPD